MSIRQESYCSDLSIVPGQFSFGSGRCVPEGELPAVIPVRYHPVWHSNIATNLTSVMLCMKYEIQQMLKQGGGSIVNTASVAGLMGMAGVPAYIASKHGVVGLTKCTALDYAKKNIRVNCVCPGYANTPLMADRVAAVGEAQLTASVPMRRMARPEEIAESVLWLASDAASFVTGHALAIDGAVTAGLIPRGTQTEEK
jgi:NAD(P)-dependent dehydrogenase (short-subunit alcohol dehydrogenase family)